MLFRTPNRYSPTCLALGTGLGLILLAGGIYTVQAEPDTAQVPQAAITPEQPELTGRNFGNKLFNFQLPSSLTPEQHKIALELIQEAQPRLAYLHARLLITLDELHNLSFDSDTPPDALAVLGRRLVVQRKDILSEMRALSVRMKQQTGLDPGWGLRHCEAPTDLPMQPERIE